MKTKAVVLGVILGSVVSTSIITGVGLHLNSTTQTNAEYNASEETKEVQSEDIDNTNNTQEENTEEVTTTEESNNEDTTASTETEDEPVVEMESGNADNLTDNDKNIIRSQASLLSSYDGRDVDDWYKELMNIADIYGYSYCSEYVDGLLDGYTQPQTSTDSNSNGQNMDSLDKAIIQSCFVPNNSDLVNLTKFASSYEDYYYNKLNDYQRNVIRQEFKKAYKEQTGKSWDVEHSQMAEDLQSIFNSIHPW